MTRRKPVTHGPLVIDKGARSTQRGEDSLFNDPHANEQNWTTISYYSEKLT